MRLFEGTVQNFKDEVINNRIADTLSENYFKQARRKVSPAEYRSWEASLRVLKDALDSSSLLRNKMIVEYRLPYSERRIDVLLFGRGRDTIDKVVLIELKQWSNENVYDCDVEGNIEVNYGNHRGQQAHPCLQVEGYVLDITDFLKVFSERPKSELEGCSYCHNYKRSSGAVLLSEKFSTHLKKYPLFTKEDAVVFGEYLKERLSEDPGFEVFDRFIHSKIGISKKLLDHTGEMINKQQTFSLIDDQIAAYNAILDRSKKLAKTNEKSVVIVKGGPGTGKSVIALEVMGELLRKEKIVFHATGSSAFTKTLRKLIGKNRKSAEKLFKFFFSFTKYPDSSIDVLICDEAHRLRKDSNDYGVPPAYKSKRPQIDDIIRPSKLSVFFIDEHQVVRPKEIGSVQLIRESAKKFGVNDSEIFEFELKTQFRCSGSDSYLQWLENTLDIRESEMVFLNRDTMMDFKIFKSPNELYEVIKEKNKEKANCARIVAGFCWPWSEPNPDGSLVNDVKIGDFEMPWENKEEFWKWATDDSGMEQVGTVYTSQGFEFDYIGVIFGKDLVYNSIKEEWEAHPENSHDKTAKNGNKRFADHLKNVYRVLMSRAHKGCYVYFMDENTENFFKSRIES
jgi:uncharacterized protein